MYTHKILYYPNFIIKQYQEFFDGKIIIEHTYNNLGLITSIMGNEIEARRYFKYDENNNLVYYNINCTKHHVKIISNDIFDITGKKPCKLAVIDKQYYRYVVETLNKLNINIRTNIISSHKSL